MERSGQGEALSSLQLEVTPDGQADNSGRSSGQALSPASSSVSLTPLTSSPSPVVADVAHGSLTGCSSCLSLQHGEPGVSPSFSVHSYATALGKSSQGERTSDIRLTFTEHASELSFPEGGALTLANWDTGDTSSTVSPPALPVDSTVRPPALTVDNTVSPPALTVDSTVSPPALTVDSTVSPPALTVDNTVSPPALTVDSTVSPSALTVDSTVSPSALTVDSTVSPLSNDKSIESRQPVTTHFTFTSAVPEDVAISPQLSCDSCVSQLTSSFLTHHLLEVTSSVCDSSVALIGTLIPVQIDQSTTSSSTKPDVSLTRPVIDRFIYIQTQEPGTSIGRFNEHQTLPLSVSATDSSTLKLGDSSAKLGHLSLLLVESRPSTGSNVAPSVNTFIGEVAVAWGFDSLASTSGEILDVEITATLFDDHVVSSVWSHSPLSSRGVSVQEPDASDYSLEINVHHSRVPLPSGGYDSSGTRGEDSIGTRGEDSIGTRGEDSIVTRDDAIRSWITASSPFQLTAGQAHLTSWALSIPGKAGHASLYTVHRSSGESEVVGSFPFDSLITRTIADSDPRSSLEYYSQNEETTARGWLLSSRDRVDVGDGDTPEASRYFRSSIGVDSDSISSPSRHTHDTSELVRLSSQVSTFPSDGSVDVSLVDEVSSLDETWRCFQTAPATSAGYSLTDRADREVSTSESAARDGGSDIVSRRLPLSESVPVAVPSMDVSDLLSRGVSATDKLSDSAVRAYSTTMELLLTSSTSLQPSSTYDSLTSYPTTTVAAHKDGIVFDIPLLEASSHDILSSYPPTLSSPTPLIPDSDTAAGRPAFASHAHYTEVISDTIVLRASETCSGVACPSQRLTSMVSAQVTVETIPVTSVPGGGATPKLQQNFNNTIIIASAGAILAVVVIVIISIVCLRRKRRNKPAPSRHVDDDMWVDLYKTNPSHHMPLPSLATCQSTFEMTNTLQNGAAQDLGRVKAAPLPAASSSQVSQTKAHKQVSSFQIKKPNPDEQQDLGLACPVLELEGQGGLVQAENWLKMTSSVSMTSLPTTELSYNTNLTDYNLAAVGHKFRAVYAYKPVCKGEMALKEGELVVCKERDRNGWMFGSKPRTNQEGWFPAVYVDEISSDYELDFSQDVPETYDILDSNKLHSPDQYWTGIEHKVCYSYKSSVSGDLTLEPGQTVIVLQTLANGWWFAVTGSSCGWMPGTYVEMIEDNSSLEVAVNDQLNNSTASHSTSEGIIQAPKTDSHSTTEGIIQAPKTDSHSTTEGIIQAPKTDSHGTSEGIIQAPKTDSHSTTEGIIQAPKTESQGTSEGLIQAPKTESHSTDSKDKCESGISRQPESGDSKKVDAKQEGISAIEQIPEPSNINLKTNSSTEHEPGQSSLQEPRPSAEIAPEKSTTAVTPSSQATTTAETFQNKRAVTNPAITLSVSTASTHNESRSGKSFRPVRPAPPPPKRKVSKVKKDTLTQANKDQAAAVKKPVILIQGKRPKLHKVLRGQLDDKQLNPMIKPSTRGFLPKPTANLESRLTHSSCYKHRPEWSPSEHEHTNSSPSIADDFHNELMTLLAQPQGATPSHTFRPLPHNDGRSSSRMSLESVSDHNAAYPGSTSSHMLSVQENLPHTEYSDVKHPKTALNNLSRDRSLSPEYRRERSLTPEGRRDKNISPILLTTGSLLHNVQRFHGALSYPSPPEDTDRAAVRLADRDVSEAFPRNMSPHAFNAASRRHRAPTTVTPPKVPPKSSFNYRSAQDQTSNQNISTFLNKQEKHVSPPQDQSSNQNISTFLNKQEKHVSPPQDQTSNQNISSFLSKQEKHVSPPLMASSPAQLTSTDINSNSEDITDSKRRPSKLLRADSAGINRDSLVVTPGTVSEIVHQINTQTPLQKELMQKLKGDTADAEIERV